MKKLLSLLATISLVSTSTASIVACDNGNGGPIDEDDNTNQDQNISTIISATDLGDINFFSLAGNDTQTHDQIINQVRNLNPNASDVQINVTDVNRTNKTATISAENFIGSVSVSFTPIISIDLIITNTNLGDVQLYSLTGNDTQTHDQIINQVRNLNPDAEDDQIIVTDVNRTNETAVIGVLGFNGTLTVTFTAHASAPISFSSLPETMIQLQDGTILVTGGTTAANSFLASVDLSNSTNLTQGAFPLTPRSIIQLDDGTILVAGGGFQTSFLSSVDLSDPEDPQIRTLAEGTSAFPSAANSMIQLQDGTILVAGGIFPTATGPMADAFLSLVDLSDPENPQIRTLAEGLDAFPIGAQSITKLQDGTILVVGGAAGGSDSFLSLVDLSDPENPQIRTLAQGASAFLSVPRSITQLQDGTILVAGGIFADNPFLATVDLSDPDNPQIQTLAEGASAFPAVPRSIIQLQDGTILIGGGINANGSDSFLALIDLSNPDNPQIQI